MSLKASATDEVEATLSSDMPKSFSTKLIVNFSHVLHFMCRILRRQPRISIDEAQRRESNNQQH
jgi:hypothetical protein